MAPKIKLKPQLSQDVAMLKKATVATAARGERGRRAMNSMARCAPGEVATT